MPGPILRIAVPSPLRRLFDYLPPADTAVDKRRVGCRAQVPFGRRQLVGIIVAISDETDVDNARLRPVDAILDEQALLPDELMALLAWAARYYHHPPGEVYAAALPKALREGKSAAIKGVQRWQLSEAGHNIDPGELARAPRQQALLHYLQQAGAALGKETLDSRFEQWRPIMRRLVEKGWVVEEETSCLGIHASERDQKPELSPAQQAAVNQVRDGLAQFGSFLLDGVTGSGKTEVYLQIIEAVIAQGKQALVLVPEIGLTPQLITRFQQRFDQALALLHSGLSDSERHCAWQAAAEGQAAIVLGTRSALFTPLKRPGIIILDEEHDSSFKQQDGFRYSARDVAIVRAQRCDIPVLLGSATPSLETLYNSRQGRYHYLHLPERAGKASHPRMSLMDVRHQRMREGIAEPMFGAIQRHLAQGSQVLLFLNRRGYAPTLLCHDCGWIARCQRCDAHMTLYQGNQRLRCHHCGSEHPAPKHCPDCESAEMRPIGQGTERVEEALAQRFPGQAVLRVDRDSTRRKGAMQAAFDRIHAGEVKLLVGTQMLSKGHHFPDVTLVGILDADQGLFSADFRATERMAQLILQVAGRAGRADKPGEVLIQTHHPEHPLLRLLIEQGYGPFAEAALKEREEALLPPFTHLALLRAEAVDERHPLAFLSTARDRALPLVSNEVMLLGPIPAPMERRAGRFRAQLLIQAHSRAALHQLLSAWVGQLEGLPEARQVRWSLDVDPAETF